VQFTAAISEVHFFAASTSRWTFTLHLQVVRGQTCAHAEAGSTIVFFFRVSGSGIDDTFIVLPFLLSDDALFHCLVLEMLNINSTSVLCFVLCFLYPRIQIYTYVRFLFCCKGTRGKIDSC
jgi:hypothetical protein